ncbi:hypothetical protein [Aquimarina rhabdastrellae]
MKNQETKTSDFVVIYHIECVKTTSEAGNDEVYFVVTTSKDPVGKKYYFDHPLEMDGSGDNSNFDIDITIPTAGLDWIKVELRERDSDSDTVSLGSFVLNEDSKPADTVTLYQPSGDQEAIYKVSYKTEGVLAFKNNSKDKYSHA